MWTEVRGLRDDIDYGTPPRDGEAVSLTVDGVSVTVPGGSSVMLAAAEAGRPVPKLCATDTLEAFGSCRVCLVEIEGQRGYPASCTTLVAPDMVVTTQSNKLAKLRKGVMELYLSDFPESEIPDGWSEFHETLEAVGLKGHRYGEGQNHFDMRIDDSNPYFLFDPAKCIVCSRCVRACEEIQGHIRPHDPGARLRIEGCGEPGRNLHAVRVRQLRSLRPGLPQSRARRKEPVSRRI